MAGSYLKCANDSWLHSQTARSGMAQDTPVDGLDRIADGPPKLRSENARLSGWVYVDIRRRDLRSVLQDMQAAVASKVVLSPGYSIS